MQRIIVSRITFEIIISIIYISHFFGTVSGCNGTNFGVNCEYVGEITQSTGGCGWRLPTGVDFLGGCTVNLYYNTNLAGYNWYTETAYENFDDCIQCAEPCSFSADSNYQIVFNCYQTYYSGGGSSAASEACINTISSCFSYSVDAFCSNPGEQPQNCEPNGPIVIGYAGMNGNAYFEDSPVYYDVDVYYDNGFSVEAASFRSSGLTGDIGKVLSPPPEFNGVNFLHMVALDVSQNAGLNGSIYAFSTSLTYLNIAGTGMTVIGIGSSLDGLTSLQAYYANSGNCSSATSCNCSGGYMGRWCSYVDHCYGGPCQNGSICSNSGSGYTCNINNCTGNQCQNGGTCVNIISGYNCTCPKNFNGTSCQNNYNGCASLNCSNGGVCNAGNYTANCTCPTNINGTYCQNNYNGCASLSCLNGGTCNVGNNTANCTCSTNYNGTWCQNNYNDCTLTNCLNGGTCIVGNFSANCTCPTNYNGTLCQNDYNGCSSLVCLNGGVCSAGNFSANCTCQPNFNGTYCQNNYTGCSLLHCFNGGVCVAGNDTASCSCLSQTNGTSCQNDYRGCGSWSCNNNGTCYLQPPSNTTACNCTGTGYNDLNCDTINDSCPGNQCENGATCVNIVNGYNCTCATNFNGTYCQNNYNGCSSLVCLNGGVCSAGNYSANCTCPTNYNGTLCQNNYTGCVNSPCLNGATCVVGNSSFSCTCSGGFTGTYCNTSITSTTTLQSTTTNSRTITTVPARTSSATLTRTLTSAMTTTTTASTSTVISSATPTTTSTSNVIINWCSACPVPYIFILSGQTVGWHNTDTTMVHFIKANLPDTYLSGNLIPGRYFYYTFVTLGTHTFYDKYNVSMTGTIIVVNSTAALQTMSSTASQSAMATTSIGGSSRTTTTASSQITSHSLFFTSYAVFYFEGLNYYPISTPGHERNAFVSAFKESVSVLCGVPMSNVTITNMSSGSIIITFNVVSASNGIITVLENILKPDSIQQDLFMDIFMNFIPSSVFDVTGNGVFLLTTGSGVSSTTNNVPTTPLIQQSPLIDSWMIGVLITLGVVVAIFYVSLMTFLCLKKKWRF